VATNRGGEPLVAREQSCIQRFREGNIDAVIGGEIAPQIPDPRQKEMMRIPANRKVSEIGKCRTAALLVDFTDRGVTAKDLRNFDIKQVRRVQGLPRLMEQLGFYHFGCRRTEKNFQQR